MSDAEPVLGDHVDVGVRATTGFLANARPPADHVHVGQWALESAAGLGMMRAFVRRSLAEQPMPPHSGVAEDLAERLTIVATELAANAMTHAGPPATVHLLRTSTSHIVEVADDDLAVVPRFAEERSFGRGGLGLHLARKLSLGMGWYTTIGLKYVWAQVATPTTTSRHLPRRAATATAVPCQDGART
jgi:anti-sigma regulatory factor (Ser/Thr protein kinase)